jgi:hypothetical protein
MLVRTFENKLVQYRRPNQGGSDLNQGGSDFGSDVRYANAETDMDHKLQHNKALSWRSYIARTLASPLPIDSAMLKDDYHMPA